MPSLRQSSAMLTSPRRPSSMMRIFSSAEWCRRVFLRMSRTVFSALSGCACLLVSSSLLAGATMSQRSSLTQSAHFVRQALTAYIRLYKIAHSFALLKGSMLKIRNILSQGDAEGAHVPAQKCRCRFQALFRDGQSNSKIPRAFPATDLRCGPG
jgi:hypothetical protein